MFKEGDFIKLQNKLLSILLLVSMFALTGCSSSTSFPQNYIPNIDYDSINIIKLSGDSATINYKNIPYYNYTSTVSPDLITVTYDGDKPIKNTHISNDIIYFPQVDEENLSIEDYNGDDEWVIHYNIKGLTEYLFGTLPRTDENIRNKMMHTKEEANNVPVLHISHPGVYQLTGEWNGQILVDLGDTEITTISKEKTVTLILNNVNITCDVAPAILFKSAYEADNNWKSRTSYKPINAATLNTGANIVIADDSINNISGANVARLLRPDYKKGSNNLQKKYAKYDGAIYSCVSMNIYGEANNTGILNLTSTTLEGLSTEFHLAINGGNIVINSQDDGINVNKNHVSTFAMNGGALKINSGLGVEGDGIDSNGFIVINNGDITITLRHPKDKYLDYVEDLQINGGTLTKIDQQNAA